MTLIADYFGIALTNLTHRKTRSYLTMIGIFIGIAAVVSLISLGQGLRAAVNDQFAGIGTDKIVISAKSVGFGPPGTGTASNITDRDIKVISATPGVKAVATRLIRSVKVEFKDQSAFVFAGSLPEEARGRKLIIDAFNTPVESGRYIEPGESNKVTIGNDYAHRDIFSRPLQTGDRIQINGKEFEVVGILAKTGRTIGGGDKVILLDNDAMRDLVGVMEAHDAVTVQVDTAEDVEAVVDSITRNLRRSRDVKEGKEDFTVQSAANLLKSLDAILGIVQVVLVGIAAISILVGGIGIMNTMYTSVIERTKEIGVMKAVGARNEDVLGIFLIESGLLGMTGGAIGVMLGMGLAKLVEIAALGAFGKSIIRASFTPELLIGALLFSFILGSISGLWPAMQAARLKPVDALRYE